MLKGFIGLAPVTAVPAVAKEMKPENHQVSKQTIQANLKATCKATKILVWQLLSFSVD